jgi:hypothetical protein
VAAVPEFLRQMKRRQRRARPIGLLIGAALCAALAIPATSAADAKRVHYRGQVVEVPKSWPVYNLANDPSRCVRLDRRAVYLGRPGANQHCPAHVVGRRKAIVIPGTRPSPPSRIGAPHRASRRQPLRATASYFTGLGFDACSTPSTTTMSAWLASPYRAIGVYIGGVNRGCSQPNLTSTWVSTEIAAGWGLIPIYVGLQAPNDSCGCASISPAQAGAQGAAAADDAVATAALLGLGPGSPIYYDMEGYSPGGSNTPAVLAFLSSWTLELHARGYVSGVYSSGSSGIADLVSQYGSGYNEPDDIWVADWNGIASASDPYLPAADWPNHQRLHQYKGGHNETWGGVTINLDNDYVDGAVAGTASAPRLVRKGRCPKVLFKHHSRYGAFNIRTFNVLHCGNARKVATASRPRRFGTLGTARVYRSRQFSCRGTAVGRARVIYVCFTAGQRSQIRFIRSDMIR